MSPLSANQLFGNIKVYVRVGYVIDIIECIHKAHNLAGRCGIGNGYGCVGNISKFGFFNFESCFIDCIADCGKLFWEGANWI